MRCLTTRCAFAKAASGSPALIAFVCSTFFGASSKSCGRAVGHRGRRVAHRRQRLPVDRSPRPRRPPPPRSTWRSRRPPPRRRGARGRWRAGSAGGPTSCVESPPPPSADACAIGKRDTCGIRSWPVTTATTPGRLRARPPSMPRMRAWACGLRTNATCCRPGSAMSATYCDVPVISRGSSLRLTWAPRSLAAMAMSSSPPGRLRASGLVVR